ncbi:hypothetical protein ACMD2_08608 [Ananas comosus]|uniref:Uncharacterized protein n=1 Tax=Ananas comosus TaxID=4615 RepID=A0A199VH87_ANACO|nr:hypothetical protein ACMD2_08608 [Ananas comosus]
MVLCRRRRRRRREEFILRRLIRRRPVVLTLRRRPVTKVWLRFAAAVCSKNAASKKLQIGASCWCLNYLALCSLENLRISGKFSDSSCCFLGIVLCKWGLAVNKS